MFDFIKHAHSGLRWIVLALLLAAIVNAFLKWRGGNSYGESDTKLDKWAMLMVHIQVVMGFVVYSLSPKVIMAGASMKDPIARFFLVEHLTIMLIAAILITIGHARKKRKDTDTARFKTVFIFYLISLVVILAGIPWPWMGYGTGWI